MMNPVWVSFFSFSHARFLKPSSLLLYRLAHVVPDRVSISCCALTMEVRRARIRGSINRLCMLAEFPVGM